MNWNREVSKNLEQTKIGIKDWRDTAERRHVLKQARRWARWQSDQLLTKEAIERGARALNESGWVCLDCNNEPGDYDQCKQCQEVCRNAFKSSLTALLGED